MMEGKIDGRDVETEILERQWLTFPDLDVTIITLPRIPKCCFSFKADFSNIHQDDPVFIYGYPEGLELSMSFGQITKRAADYVGHDAGSVLEYKIPSNPPAKGNSGSPIVNKDFSVIGVHFAKVPKGGKR